MEYHSGKLKIIPKESGENLEDQCKRLVNRPLHVYYKNYVEMITDQFREKYIIHNNNIYEIYENCELLNIETIQLNKEADGNYSFEGYIYKESSAFFREYLLDLLKTQ